MKKLAVLSLLVLGLAACRGETTNEKKLGNKLPNIDPETSKQTISATFDNVNASLAELRDSSGLQTLFRFYNLENGVAQSEDWGSDILGELVSAIELDDDLSNYGEYRFSDHTGTYTWNGLYYDATPTPADKIVASFPANEQQSDNNVTLTLSNYADADLTIDGEHLGAPTALDAKLEVDGSEQLSFSGSASYSNDVNFVLPVLADLALSVSPFDAQFNFERVTSTHFTASAGITGPDSFVVSADADLRLLSDDYEALEPDTDFDSLAVTLQINDLRFEVTIDFDALAKLDEPTALQINSFVEVNVFSGEGKLGEVVVREVDYEYGDLEDLELDLVFSDGSREDFGEYLEPFIEQFEADFSPYFGMWYSE